MLVGPVVITLFLIGMLVIEHILADDLYDSLTKRWSKEYVRRYRIALKVSAMLMIGHVWATTLDKELRLIATQLVWLVVLAMSCLGIWTLLGVRKKE